MTKSTRFFRQQMPCLMYEKREWQISATDMCNDVYINVNPIHLAQPKFCRSELL